MKNYIIITGASRGLGEGIAMSLLHPDNHIVSISRGKSKNLQDLAKVKECQVTFESFDLAFPEKISDLSKDIFNEEKLLKYKGIFLVNNAGVVEPVGPSGVIDNIETIKHININLLSPMLLVSEFIKYAGHFPVRKRVINISSGAAINPYEGWSAYCSGKAGLDMFSRCVAKEQESKDFPVEIMSVAPGVIDTDMQAVIRNTTAEKFIHKQRFVQLKEGGVLVLPDIAGKHIAELLFSTHFINGGVVDIRDKFKK